MKVLVTGATGFIGARLRDDLVAAGHEVVGVTRGQPPAGTPGCTWVRMDLADPRADIPPVPGVDAVVFLAQAHEYREFPAKARAVFGVNASALLAYLDWARVQGVRSFVYTSSANVYPASQGLIAESSPAAPESFYGRTKLIGEMLVSSYADYFGCVVLRLFTVYGPGQTRMLIPSLVEKIGAGRPVQLQGADGLILSPLFVADAARFVCAALEHQTRTVEVVNAGGPEALTLRQIASQIGNAVGRSVTFAPVDGPEPGGWASDNTRALERLRVAPETSFREGIRRVVTAPAAGPQSVTRE